MALISPGKGYTRSLGCGVKAVRSVLLPVDFAKGKMVMEPHTAVARGVPEGSQQAPVAKPYMLIPGLIRHQWKNATQQDVPANPLYPECSRV